MDAPFAPSTVMFFPSDRMFLVLATPDCMFIEEANSLSLLVRPWDQNNLCPMRQVPLISTGGDRLVVARNKPPYCAH
jgi:hypothetical protein